MLTQQKYFRGFYSAFIAEAPHAATAFPITVLFAIEYFE
jgi:hypothetical protein